MTPAQRLALEEKVSEIAFYGMPESLVADILNTPNVLWGTKRIDVPIAPVRTLFLKRLELAKLQVLTEKVIAEDDPDFVNKTFLRIVALTAFATLNRTDLTVIPTVSDEDYAAASQMLGVLYEAGIISLQTMQESIAMAFTEQSWGESNGFTNGITARDVGLARGDE